MRRWRRLFRRWRRRWRWRRLLRRWRLWRS
jgi:hypothetical protein